MFNSFYIINSKGERKPFSLRKIYRSARHAGASSNLAKKISRTIQKEAYPGITSNEIFKKIRRLLSREAKGVAIKFSLKEAMRKLGPTGFPFEKYIAEIFLRNGYKVKLNQYVPGFCLSYYEIDFVAQKDNLIYFGECKYHNLRGGRVHTDVTLANFARFLDIKKRYFLNKKRVNIKSLLVTNTKFTKKAIRYSQCVGVDLLGWNYPKGKGLEHLIDNQKLYPITILPSLNSHLAEIFVSKKMMLAEDALRPDLVRIMGGTKTIRNDLIKLKKEARMLLG